MLGSGLLLTALSGHAQQCAAPLFVYTPGAGVLQDPSAPVEALADNVISEDGLITLEGNTSISWQGRTITAENATYDPETGDVEINGDLRFEAEGVRVQSNQADIDIDNTRFSTGSAEYEIDLNGSRATGKAQSMERMEDGSFLMRGATYSSCPALDNSWFIKANRIALYPDDGIGVARNIVLRFKGVPILGLPVFSFPISPDRKTGFLGPSLGSSDSTGYELEVPWYWNIRPNLDATITPRFMSRRGLQLQTELRYLNEQGSWTLDNEVLKDRRFNDERRRFTQLRHSGQFGPFWKSSIRASEVTDKDYFEDLGNSLQVASITHLERRADVVYDWNDTQIEVRLQSYQTVDRDILPEQRPYKRLPQFTYKTVRSSLPLGIQTEFDSEFVFFDRDDSITGLRVDAVPRISLPMSGSAWFFKPSFSHRFTHYRLDNTGADVASRQSRNTNTLSLDGGLFFDRLLDDGSVLTLEPRLFYLRTPYEDQREIPIFDSNEFDFNISQLFRENRFTGADRVADANQLSVGFSSRLIDGGDGREVIRGSLGQILYFDDRRVFLDNQDEGPDTNNTSDLVGELAGDLHRNWRAKGNIQWNPNNDNTVRSSVLFTYRPSHDKIVNFGHRNVGNDTSADTEQIDFSFLWPISDQWRAAGRWNYSLDGNTSIETLLGLEYNSCCWAFRFAARRYIAEDGMDHDTNFYLQLVLKGLAPLGQNYGDLLEYSILGYRDEIE